MPHPWIGFERSIVRRRSVSGRLCVLIIVVPCLYLFPVPSPLSPSPFPFARRDVLIFDTKPLLVRVRASREHLDCVNRYRGSDCAWKSRYLSTLTGC